MVPRPDVPRGSDRRRGQRLGRGDRALRTVPGTSTRSRSIPKLQEIGRERHPNQPYSDPRVTPYVNDGRAFLRNSDKKYDLVIFALPDSLTLVSQQSNIRLESFLFTEEAFRSVRDHLTDDGVFVLYNYYRDDWLVAKLVDDARGRVRQPAAGQRLRRAQGGTCKRAAGRLAAGWRAARSPTV